MARLKLWIAKQDSDSACYNLLSKTRKGLLAQIKQQSHVTYHTIERVQITYKDAFDLFEWVTGEGGGRDGAYTTLSEHPFNYSELDQL